MGWFDLFTGELSSRAYAATPAARTWTVPAESRVWVVEVSDDMQTWEKDPDAVLDYKWDLDSWLALGETVTRATTTVEAGINLESLSVASNGRSVTAWVSGGTTVGETYDITLHFETSAGREEDATMRFEIVEK